VTILRFASGARLLLDALGLLRRERAIRRAATAPGLVSLAALGLGLAAVFGWARDLYAFATSWVPSPAAASWYDWIWVGPARLVLDLAGVLSFVAVAGAVVVAALLVGAIFAAPLLDRLSRRVEEVVTGGVVDRSRPGIAGFAAGAARSGLEELKRVAFFLGVQAAILVVGALVPGAQAPAATAMIAVTALFLALDSASYALERRGLGFREKLRWSRRHLAIVAGYGAAAFLLCSIPVVNLIALPLLVVAGTLLVIDVERAR